MRGPRGGMIMIGEDMPNPMGKKTSKGKIRKLSSVLDSAVFPGTQGGPLEHVIASKAVAFGEALTDEFKQYQNQVLTNAKAMAEAFVDLGYKVISGGTDNHSMLIDLRTKVPQTSGKVVEKALEKADITLNKNMVPFDDRSPFQTSGIRVGTAAVTTRGVTEELMKPIAELIDRVIQNPENTDLIQKVRKQVNEMMDQYPLFKE